MPEEIVGKSDADGWNIEEYVTNTGSVGRKKITFVGASYKFVHKVLRDMLLVGGFNDVELCVHDLREEPMNLVADLLERIARQKKSNVRITRTLDPETALSGADAVILSITTGGLEAEWRSFEVCFKYGIPVCIGDTLGPAALARNLRCIPVVVDIGRAMAKYCPNAVMLNFTNPMSAITGAIERFSGIPAWGLCHSADELFRYFAKVFNVRKTEVEMEIGGVNHQSFVTRLMIRGIDRTSGILEATLGSDAKLEDSLLETRRENVDLQQDLYRILGAWPSCGHSHAAEFYRYFFTRENLLRYKMRLQHVVPGRKPETWIEPHPIIREWTYGPEPVGDLHLLTTEHAHELLWSLFTGEPFTRVLNVLNSKPFIKGIPKTACVETLVTLSGRELDGRTITLPPVIQSLVAQWTTIHELSIQAAMNKDRDALRQALFLDPHMKELHDIAPMAEDILSATREWLPAEWFE